MKLTLRSLVVPGAAVAALLCSGLVSGCAQGTHPGAAAVVGDTEISVEQVDRVSRSVTTALGQPFTVALVLNEMVRGELVAQVTAQRSVTVTEAEIARAMKVVLGDPAAFQRFEADPVAHQFLREVARTALGMVKLGGGDSLTGQSAQQAGQAGSRIVLDEAKKIEVTVSPRFGKWSGEQIADVSGSLSVESDQTRQQREQRSQQQQERPQG